MISPEIETAEKIQEITDIQVPGMYKVILHNDDTTTVEFVIHVLTHIFHKTPEDAFELTQLIHETGQAIAGSPYTKEVAEEKTLETLNSARINNFPLTATFEEI